MRSKPKTLVSPNLKAEAREQAEVLARYLFERGVNFRDRVILLNGDLDTGSFAAFDAAMSELEGQGSGKITVRINSLGGSTYEALAIVGRLRASKCDIHTEGYGAVMSAATLILASGKYRRMSRYAWAMFHEANFEVSGRRENVENEVRQRRREEKAWAEAMAEFSTVGIDYWFSLGTHMDAYFEAEELIELGVIDEIF